MLTKVKSKLFNLSAVPERFGILKTSENIPASVSHSFTGYALQSSGQSWFQIQSAISNLLFARYSLQISEARMKIIKFIMFQHTKYEFFIAPRLKSNKRILNFFVRNLKFASGFSPGQC